MCNSIIGESPAALEANPVWAASLLDAEGRKDLAVRVLARAETVTQMAAENGVSRKFLYQQAAKASDALDTVFEPADEEGVLTTITVTREWIHRAILSLALICHSSYRGAVEFLEGMVGVSVSVGTIHNVIQDAAHRARELNEAQDLSLIRIGAHDEIFQVGKPVLVGADVNSTYCYLLSQEEHRDETTWGVHLLDLAERGLHPDFTIADGGSGLRAGQTAAWSDVPCHGDVFHAVYDLGKLATHLERRASGCTSAREKVEEGIRRFRKHMKRHPLAKRLAMARQAETQAVQLATNFRILSNWMREDVLSVAGPDLPSRRALFDFIIEQMKSVEHLCPYRITPVRRALENQRDALLAHVGILDGKILDIAERLRVPSSTLHAMCEIEALPRDSTLYWQRRTKLQKQLADTYPAIETALREAVAETPRASSVIENLNSRLRNYFFLRKAIGSAYLDLLRFFLNHHRFQRSEHPERVGRSPAELLTQHELPLWLDALVGDSSGKN